jgi:hypothetical protein
VVSDSNEAYGLLIFNIETTSLAWLKLYDTNTRADGLALHLGREYMVTNTFENFPLLFRCAALYTNHITSGRPSIMNLFRGNGNVAQRSAILALVVQDSEILEFMKLSKREIARYTCWRRHEEVFVKSLKLLSITSKDICAEWGMFAN